MRQRGPYHTKQQQQILTFLEQNAQSYHTVQTIFETLKAVGAAIGHTTVYRTLEKFSDRGIVVRVPGINGKPAQYKYEDVSKSIPKGELCCKKCGAITPLHCNEIDSFTSHLSTNHHFVMRSEDIVFYGYCETCIEPK